LIGAENWDPLLWGKARRCGFVLLRGLEYAWCRPDTVAGTRSSREDGEFALRAEVPGGRLRLDGL
jgi:hypothetical protein